MASATRQARRRHAFRASAPETLRTAASDGGRFLVIEATQELVSLDELYVLPELSDNNYQHKQYYGAGRVVVGHGGNAGADDEHDCLSGVGVRRLRSALFVIQMGDLPQGNLSDLAAGPDDAMVDGALSADVGQGVFGAAGGPAMRGLIAASFWFGHLILGFPSVEWAGREAPPEIKHARQWVGTTVPDGRVLEDIVGYRRSKETEAAFVAMIMLDSCEKVW